MTALETAVIEAVDRLAAEIEHLAVLIGGNPELGYREHGAVAAITDLLDEHGEAVETGVAGMQTAFRAGAQADERPVAILAEYDALPEIGHACGHHIIAASAVGAFLALRAARPDLPVVLLGCPAEESTVPRAGGKIRLLDAGVFEEVSAAIMVHPYETSGVVREGALAARGFDLVFTGRAAHAAMAPEDGVNALDAAVLAYTGVSHLRQQLPSDVRVHGIIADGGRSPNVIPDRAALRYRIRSPDLQTLEGVSARVLGCAEGAALAASAELAVDEFMPPYAEIRQDPGLARIAERVMEHLTVDTTGARHLRFGSSDFGNVSHRVPSLEIGIGIGTPGAKPHTVDFREAALSAEGIASSVLGAKATALTICRHRAAGA